MQDEPSAAAISGKAFKIILTVTALVVGITQTPLLGVLSSAQANLVASVGTYLQANPVSQSLDDALVGHWTFDGPDISWSDATAEVKDRSSEMNHGNAIGLSESSVSTGVIGQALLFDGINDYIDTNNGGSLDNLAAFTFSAWVKIHDTGTSRTILSKRSNTGGETLLQVNESNQIRVVVANAAGPANGTAISNETISPGEWSHVSVTYDHAGSRRSVIYIDGVEVTYSEQDTIGTLDLNSSYDYWIGDSEQGIAGWFVGVLDDVRIYDRLLSSDEIQKIYNETKSSLINTTPIVNNPLEDGLVGHWTFDGPDINWSDTGAEIKDQSPEGNNGDAVNLKTQSVTIGKTGQALEFNGESSFIDFGDIEMSSYTELAVSVWINTSNALSTQRVVAKDQIGIQGNFILWFNSGNWEFLLQDSVLGGWQRATYASTLPNDGEWHHLVGVMDQETGSIYLYVDGVEVATDDFTASTLDDSENEILVVGSDSDPGTKDNFFDGLIDDVRIYNRALSPDEVTRLYQQGNGVTVKTCGPGTYVFDTEGNRYGTVKIGNQCWMAQNLNVGTRVNRVTTQTDNATIEKWCYSDNDANCDTNNNPTYPDGGLYQWDEAMQYSATEGAQGICPAGWHIPTDQDFKDLEIFLGMSSAAANTTGYRGTDQGAQLRSGGSSGWEGNLSGWVTFTGFGFRGSVGYVWLSSGSGPTAWNRIFTSGLDQIARNQLSKTTALPVRCVED